MPEPQELLRSAITYAEVFIGIMVVGAIDHFSGTEIRVFGQDVPIE
jgi:hypothetical protein